MQHLLDVPLEYDADGYLKLSQDVVISAAIVVIAEKSGHDICPSHICLKYKQRSKEFGYSKKEWLEDTKDVGSDLYVHRDIYVVPVIDAESCCDKCG